MVRRTRKLIKMGVVLADRRTRKLIFSIKPKEEEELVEKKRSLMAQMQMGDIVKCCIKNTYFGVFVEASSVFTIENRRLQFVPSCSTLISNSHSHSRSSSTRSSSSSTLIPTPVPVRSIFSSVSLIPIPNSECTPRSPSSRTVVSSPRSSCWRTTRIPLTLADNPPCPETGGFCPHCTPSVALSRQYYFKLNLLNIPSFGSGKGKGGMLALFLGFIHLSGLSLSHHFSRQGTWRELTQSRVEGKGAWKVRAMKNSVIVEALKVDSLQKLFSSLQPIL